MQKEIIQKKSAEIEDNFRHIRDGIIGSVSRLSSFLREVDPQIQYFFANTGDGHNFFSEVISSSQKNLKDAIQRAIRNMEGDVSVHERSRSAMKQTMVLNEGVTRIVELLEYIEIFSLNTLIISAKSGAIGEGLSTISGEMTRLSRLGSELSSEITGKMTLLEKSIGGFDSLKEEIENLHEKNLTFISLSSSSVFKDLDKHLQSVSGEVLGNYAMIETVTESLRMVSEKFQYEDIVRQGFEKVIFSLDCYLSEKEIIRSKDDSIDQNTIRTIFGDLSQMKLNTIGQDVTRMFSELKISLSEVLSVLDIFYTSLTALEDRETSTEGKSLGGVTERLSTLRANYESYVEKVYAKKQQMLQFLESAEKELEEFSLFFSQMLNISHKFKTIILLTHIEVARYSELSHLLEGALKDVSDIPVLINDVVDQISKEYEQLIDSLRIATEDYRRMF
ncbi:MAG TPA: hypothetical protein VF857_04020, partial [Spirochaetota bacterium]